MKTKSNRSFIYCSFYANKKRLGGAYIPEGSTADERKKIALSKGIRNHNAIVFHDRNKYIKFRFRPNYLQLYTYTYPQFKRILI